MHIFGGTASTGLLCSFYAILRSVSAVAVLWGLGYAGFSQLDVSLHGFRIRATLKFGIISINESLTIQLKRSVV